MAVTHEYGELHLGLTGFLQESAGRAFQWGECDCCLWGADWIKRVRGIDPAADLRGTYSTKGEALRIILFEGGLMQMVSRRLESHGFEPTRSPDMWDVGIIVQNGIEAVAIKGSRGWYCKSERGLILAPFPFLKAWGI
jgi:hypothetical protein